MGFFYFLFFIFVFGKEQLLLLHNDTNWLLIGHSEELFKLETKAHSDLISAINMETSFYRQKSRLKWLEDGDRNSNFFHKLVSNRKKLTGIKMLEINGESCTDSEIIKKHVVDFYRNLFNGTAPGDNSDFHLIQEVIPKLINEA